MEKTYTIIHEGFHGRRVAKIRPISTEGEGDDMRGIISQRTARRLDVLVCGIYGCCCGEHWAQGGEPWAQDPVYWVSLSPREQRGNYPQRR